MTIHIVKGKPRTSGKRRKSERAPTWPPGHFTELMRANNWPPGYAPRFVMLPVGKSFRFVVTPRFPSRVSLHFVARDVRAAAYEV